MDSNLREPPKRGEGWSREASRVKRLMEGGMQLTLHAGGSIRCAFERVEDVPVVMTQIKSDEVSGPVVPRPTSGGNGGKSRVPEWGEMVGAGPPRGGLSQAENLIDLRLL